MRRFFLKKLNYDMAMDSAFYARLLTVTPNNFRVCAWRKCLEERFQICYILGPIVLAGNEKNPICWVFGFSFSKNMTNFLKAFLWKFHQAQTLKLLGVTLHYMYIYRDIRSTTLFIHLEGPRDRNIFSYHHSVQQLSGN